MASLATNWIGNKLAGSIGVRRPAPMPNRQPNGPVPNKPQGPAQQAVVRSERKGTFALRALPNEDIALWVKAIDNSRVSRQLDTGVRNDLWRFIGGAVAAVALVVGLLLPGAYSWLAGYQLSSLERQHKEQLEQRELLKLEQARAESPKQLQKWAEEHGMKAPDSRRQVYLRPSSDRSVAMKTTGASASNR